MNNKVCSKQNFCNIKKQPGIQVVILSEKQYQGRQSFGSFTHKTNRLLKGADIRINLKGSVEAWLILTE
jgi:hypothetical protein